MVLVGSDTSTISAPAQPIITPHTRRSLVVKEVEEENPNQEGKTTKLPSTSSYTELRIDGPPLYNQGAVLVTDRYSNATTLTVDPCLSLHADTTALLVVDVQPQYWSQCPAVRKDFPNFPSNMQKLLHTCRQRGAPIIWVYADYRFDHSPWLKQFHRLHQGRIPPEVHFDDQTGWESFAQPLANEPTIAKSSWSSTSSTRLLSLLEFLNVDTVLVCGLITSVCVQHSAFGVFEAGHRTILVTDACADRGIERHRAALALYGDYMYELKTVESVSSELVERSLDVTCTDDDSGSPPSPKRIKKCLVEE